MNFYAWKFFLYLVEYLISQLFIGTNGAGKTNILNAINWCLYNDEPHLSKKSEGLPIPNLRAIENLKLGEELKVSAELWVEFDDSNNSTCFKRNARYRKTSNNIIPVQSTELEVYFSDENLNNKIARDDEAIELVKSAIK